MKKVTLHFIFIISIICNQLIAQVPVRDSKKEEKIEQQLAAINPTLVKIFHEGTIAMDKQDYKVADSLYSIVYAQAPNFDPLIRRRGNILLSLGKTKEGIELCKKAVSINRSAYNLANLAEAYLIAKDSTQLYEAQQLLKEAMKLPNGEEIDILANYTQISIELNDITSFEEAVSLMKSKYPNEMLTYYFSALQLANKEQWSDAKEAILIAQEKGLPKENVDQFLDSGINDELLKINVMIYFGVVVAIWALGLLLLFIVGKVFSSMTLKAIESNDLESSAAKSEGWLRSGYKKLINIGGVYYYISLPIILLLVIALTVGILYLFLLAGTIPIKLAVILVIGAVITIYNMIRSLLLKVNYTDPGRELKREEASKLFNLTDEVANLMGTRPIEEIRITPLTDLAVYEKGTKKEKNNDNGKRILILGTAVLKDFKTKDFKAVLAHEYGHFTNRDTAGGEVAFRVQNDISKFFIALYNAQQNTVWNVAFHFLRLYNFIFSRISHGATRLQEVLADRVAAETFGQVAFVNGLTHVIRRQIEFDKYANIEIESAIELKRPINNLYDLQVSQDATIDEELNKILSSKTTEDDTHPSPADRFRYIQGIECLNTVEDDSYVKDLFENWDDLTAEMTKSIEENVERNQ